MDNPTSFKLPPSFLSQLNEFTLGYLLITVNEAGEFETFVKAETPITRVGLVKFAEMISDSLSCSLEQNIANPTNDDEQPTATDPFDELDEEDSTGPISV